MTEATSPPSLPSASSLCPCGRSSLRRGPLPWELPPDPPELDDSVSELFLLRVDGGSSPKWTLSALLVPLIELARLLVDWALRMAGRMSEAASSQPPVKRRFWKTMGSDTRDPSPPSVAAATLSSMHRRSGCGERWKGAAAECRGSSWSSSGMDRGGGGWRAAREEDREERRGRDGSEEAEPLELKRGSFSESATERELAARGSRGDGGFRMPGPGRRSWTSAGSRERADDLRLRVEAPVVW